MAAAISERFVNNFLTIMIARVAMIVTPFLIAAMGYAFAGAWDFAMDQWKQVNDRLDAIEASDNRQVSQIQDHESRLKFSDEKASQYADQIERRFNDLGGSLKDLNQQIISINGSIIRLQTTIENRLPPRTAKIEPEPQLGGEPIPQGDASVSDVP